MDDDRVSHLCRELDDHVEQFRTRPRDCLYPYLWLDAKVHHEPLSDRGCRTPPPGCHSSAVN